MQRFAFIRNAGQTGVERAALNIARQHGIAVTGWCPSNGIVDDSTQAPGIMRRFPELREIPGGTVEACLDLNTRDSHASLIIAPIGSPLDAPRQVVDLAGLYDRRVLLISDIDDERALRDWVSHLGYGIDLHVTGPTERQWPGAHDLTHRILNRLFTRTA